MPIRIKSDLHNKILAVQEKADTLGLEFNMSDIIRDALLRSVNSAANELEIDIDDDKVIDGLLSSHQKKIDSKKKKNVENNTNTGSL